tara:strand:- start:198 stop:353 length:156 start_codon:yes stop_codon:yes gene_type:complete
MSLLEAWDYEIARRYAIEEILLHNVDPQEFYDECGFKKNYMGSEVLTFLGY